MRIVNAIGVNPSVSEMSCAKTVKDTCRSVFNMEKLCNNRHHPLGRTSNRNHLIARTRASEFVHHCDRGIVVAPISDVKSVL